MGFLCCFLPILVWLHLLLNDVTGFVDTSKWFGAEYTPSSASNSLWWYYYTNYTSQIDHELNLIENKLKFNSLRMFLHNMVYNASGSTTYIKYIDNFLNKTISHNIRVGFVFFDDCWNMNGANISSPCKPTPGVHNGCWMACPQQNERDINNLYQFKSYVTDIVEYFAKDNRIIFWEIYNEPNKQSAFSEALRNTAYQWMLSIDTNIPIISCWDNNNNTQISDMHRYDNNFEGWKQEIALGNNGNKSTVITEGGARWYAGYSDTGSPIEVINFLENYRKNPINNWYPGIFMNWEVMAGNSNTRWHWGSQPYSPEPNIPFDSYLFPDGTPVSETEVALIRRYITNKNEFILLNTFLPKQDNLTKDYYLILNMNDTWKSDLNISSSNYIQSKYDLLIEFSFWPNTNINNSHLKINLMFDLKNEKNSNKIIESYLISIDMEYLELSLFRLVNQLKTELVMFNISDLDCGVTTIGWNTLRAKINWNWKNIENVLMMNTNLSIWLNPMYENSKQPRISYNDLYNITDNSGSYDISIQEIELNTIGHSGEQAFLDYVSVLPGNVTTM